MLIFVPCKSVKSCNTINEINFLCLPSGGSTDDQQNGHNRGNKCKKRGDKMPNTDKYQVLSELSQTVSGTVRR